MTRIKKKWAVVAVVAAVFIGGGAAFAYWSNTGSGSGTAATGTNVPITVNQTSTVTALAPGLSAQALSGTFDNPNASPVYVTSVSATVTGTDKVNCDATDYTISGSPAAVGREIPAGTGVGTWSGITIQFNDKLAVNQNACKGATVTISYTSN